MGRTQAGHGPAVSWTARPSRGSSRERCTRVSPSAAGATARCAKRSRPSSSPGRGSCCSPRCAHASRPTSLRRAKALAAVGSEASDARASEPCCRCSGAATDARGAGWLHVSPGPPERPLLDGSGRPGRHSASTPWRIGIDPRPASSPPTRTAARYARSKPSSVKRRHRLPTGTFFVEESIALNSDEVGAPYALALSARSQELRRFAGGRADRAPRPHERGGDPRHSGLPRLRPPRWRDHALARGTDRAWRPGDHHPLTPVQARRASCARGCRLGHVGGAIRANTAACSRAGRRAEGR